MDCLRPTLEVREVRCEECPVGRAFGWGAGGFCPTVPRHFAPGEALTREGDPAERIWLVRDGIVSSEAGGVRRIHLPGAALGTEGLVRERYAVTARALTPVRACGVIRDVIRSWLK